MLTDKEIEQAVTKAGGGWDENHWKFEDADLHPFVRGLLAAELERCQRVCRSMSFEFNAGSREQDVLQRVATRLGMSEHGA